MTSTYFEHALTSCLNADLTQLNSRSIVLFNASQLALDDFDLAQVFSPFERNIYDRRKSYSAKQEYLATRLLLKFLLKRTVSQFKLTALKDISSQFDESSSKLQLHVAGKVFNSCISHSHGFVGVGLNLTAEQFGFDIEKISHKRPFEKLAKHFYHPHEIDLITAAEQPQCQAERFYRIWTLKEALAKATSRPIAKLLSPNVFAQLQLAQLNANSMQLDGFDISVVSKKNTDWRCFSVKQIPLLLE